MRGTMSFKDAQANFTPSRPLTELECTTIAANISADTVREQQVELGRLEIENIRLRAALSSIYKNATFMTGQESVQALIDGGALKAEDFA